MLNVLYFRLPSDDEYDNWFTFLRGKVSAACYKEACDYRNKEVGIRRLVGEALACRALEEYGHLPFGSYRIERGDKGKPFVVDRADVFFNISHSGEYVVCVVSCREVGIDIEKRARARMEVAGRFFHQREVSALEALEGESRDKLFFDYWSVKESFLKYIGTGLTRPLNSFEVLFSGERISLCEGERELPVHVRVCPIDAGYACHVCGGYDLEPGIREITWK